MSTDTEQAAAVLSRRQCTSTSTNEWWTKSVPSFSFWTSAHSYFPSWKFGHWGTEVSIQSWKKEVSFLIANTFIPSLRVFCRVSVFVRPIVQPWSYDVTEFLTTWLDHLKTRLFLWFVESGLKEKWCFLLQGVSGVSNQVRDVSEYLIVLH